MFVTSSLFLFIDSAMRDIKMSRVCVKPFLTRGLREAEVKNRRLTIFIAVLRHP